VPTEIGRDVVFLAGAGGRSEAVDGCQLVIGVERRSMACGAAFASEDRFAARRRRIETIRIRRGVERIDVQRQRIHLLVAVAAVRDESRLLGIGEGLEIGKIGGDQSVETGQVVAALVQGRLAHQVDDGPLLLQAGAIQISPILHADNVRQLHGVERAGMVARHHSRRITS
jgi:hypothetical protein